MMKTKYLCMLALFIVVFPFITAFTDVGDVETYILASCSGSSFRPPEHSYYQSQLWDVTANVVLHVGMVVSDSTQNFITYKGVFIGMDTSHEYRQAIFKQGHIIGDWSERFKAPSKISAFIPENCNLRFLPDIIKGK